MFNFLNGKGLGKKTSWLTSVGAFIFGIVATGFIMYVNKRFPTIEEGLAITIVMWGASLVTGTTDLSIIINNFFKAKYGYKDNNDNEDNK